MSVPLTNILTSPFEEGIVPTQWKKGIVVPVPKQNPPSLDKLRPISLTSIFAKVAQGFVSKWVIDDIGHSIDIRQFGTVAGVSTNHYLIDLIHYLHEVAENTCNTGTVVFTDFSKAFDLVDHTILINKIIQVGVCRNIVPWICDFLQNRLQSVTFNNTLSDDLQRTAGVPQGTKLGPIGFRVLLNDSTANAPLNTRSMLMISHLQKTLEVMIRAIYKMISSTSQTGHPIMGSISMPRNAKLLRSNLATPLHIEQI